MSLAPLVITSVLLIFVTLLSAVISALETALLSLKEHHVAVIGESHPARAGMMRAIARHPHRTLHQIVLLGSVMNLVIAVLGLLLVREAGPFIPGHPGWSAVALFGVLIIVSELIPSLVAMASPARTFQWFLKPLVILSPTLERLAAALEGVTEKLTRFLLPFPLQSRRDLSDDEIETLIGMRREEGVLAPSESEIIQQIIRLGNKTAKDCMTPRVDAFMIAISTSASEALEQLRAAPRWYWRVPVHDGGPDVVVGVLDVKRWLHEPDSDFRDHISAPVFVPETMNALEAFRDYLRVPRSLCVVLDEYGGVEGVLTHADMVEEILAQAAPALDQEAAFERLTPGKLRADGDARLDEIGEALGMDLDHEGLDTIGGLAFNALGQMPRPGTVVEVAGLRITVRLCLAQRITCVEVERLPEASPAPMFSPD